MWFKKKEVKTEKKENKLISLVNGALTKYEKQFVVDFSKPKSEFSFLGGYGYLSSFEKQDFAFAEDYSISGIRDLKSSIIYLKNEFASQDVDNKIIFSKLKEVEKFEIMFQEKIKKENIFIQTKNVNGILFSTVELFQSFSRDYLNLVIKIKQEILNFINKNFVAIDLVNEFSKILKEQENMPKELTDYKLNLNGYSVIYNLENFLRVLIITNFKGIPLKQYLSSEHKKYIQEQKEKEKENRWCDERQGGDLFYLTLAHLIEIIRNNKAVFKDKDILISKIEDPLNKIIVIRNKLAHNILITKDDLDCIKTNNKIVIKYLDKQKDDVINYKFNKKKNNKI